MLVGSIVLLIFLTKNETISRFESELSSILREEDWDIDTNFFTHTIKHKVLEVKICNGGFLTVKGISVSLSKHITTKVNLFYNKVYNRIKEEFAFAELNKTQERRTVRFANNDLLFIQQILQEKHEQLQDTALKQKLETLILKLGMN